MFDHVSLKSALLGTCVAVSIICLPVGGSPAFAQCTNDWAMNLPSARTDADIAFDSARNKVVLFGGLNGTAYLNDTWECDSATGRWKRVASIGPEGRRGHKLVYDASHRRTLLIGGYASPALGAMQTWAWDGGTWRLIDSAGPSYPFSSSAALEMAVAYNPTRGRVVAYLANGETWEWDNLSWTRMAAAAGGPGARRGMGLGFDRSSSRIILFGGTVGSSPRNDTWAWDGAAWVQLTPTTSPTARSDFRTSYDSIARRMVIHGGAISGGRAHDTWAFSGATWVQTNSSGPLTAAGGAGSCMTFDALRRHFILLGGANSIWADIYDFDGVNWVQTDLGPSARAAAASAYDTNRHRLVMFGGLGTSRTADTWEYDGTRWTLVANSGPPARSEAAMAYDPVRQRTVLFGGMATTTLNDTWEWDGAVWTRINVAGPSARDRHAMCYDPVSQQVMLEGGSAGGNETWFYNGQAWTRSTNGPTRSSHAMCYHPASHMVILYGGSGAGTSQTAWAWNGSTWMAYGGPGPSTALEHTMTVDPVSGNVVLLGASASDAAAWLFDSSVWRRVPSGTGAPRPRNNHCAWYDDNRGTMCWFGGTVASTPNRETWEYRGVAGPALAHGATWTVSCEQGTAQFEVQLASGSPAADAVVWTHNGQVVSAGLTGFGSTIATVFDPATLTYSLTVTGTTLADTGDYRCILSTACGGATVTNPARLSICPADFNCSGTGAGDGVTPQDIFDFFTAYFGGDMRADLTRDGILSPQDFLEYLNRYFTGC